ncbi:MAG: sigma-70 family RNA polymerase sigma factor [Actinomycetota bacterium]
MTSNGPVDQPTTAEELWREFGSSLRQFVARRVNNPADVDEIVQDIFLRLHTKIDEIDEPTGWIYRVARNSIIDHYRSATRRREVPSDITSAVELLPPLPDVAADDSDVWQEFLGCVEPLLSGLNDTDRQAVALVDMQGRTQAGVAAELGLSVSGMKSRVQRARQKMLGALEECCEIELDVGGRPMGMTRRDTGASLCSPCSTDARTQAEPDS